MSNAPVCHISTDQGIIKQPKGVHMPSIPTPVDLPSAIAAINALKIIIQQLAGMTPAQGPRGISGTRGINGLNGKAGQGSIAGGTDNTNKAPQKVGRWAEVNRTTETKRIFHKNPDGTTDKEQFVDVKRINSLVFQDNVTGEIWIWRR